MYIETYRYRHFSWTRINGGIETLLVLDELLSEEQPVTDFIARPDSINQLSDDGIVEVEAPSTVTLADYFEGK